MFGTGRMIRQTVSEGAACNVGAMRPTGVLMERFNHNENLLHLRKQLEKSTDEAQRRQILRLLAEELKKKPDSGDDYLRSKVLKRSIVVGGHRTSVSLEDVFWSEFRSIANEMSLPVSELIARIDAERKHAIFHPQSESLFSNTDVS
jgi:hypothetical protein